MNPIRNRLAALEQAPRHQRPHLVILDDGNQKSEALSPLKVFANGYRMRLAHCRPFESPAGFLQRIGFDASAYQVIHVPCSFGYSEPRP